MDVTTIMTKVEILPFETNHFIDWQANFNAKIASFPGFVSFEILNGDPFWTLVERFNSKESLAKWRESEDYVSLVKELKTFLLTPTAFEEVKSSLLSTAGGVTEILITEINPENEEAYRKWLSKIHQAEAKFPGFKGMFVQSPAQNKGKNWITFLQFDTQENLEKWLVSSERAEILSESEPLIHSLEHHRVISSYAGWFHSLSNDKDDIPPVWKQTMLVLLVLYPIIMLELRYLNVLTKSLPLAVSTFIGNALSVSLISWPMMPIAIYYLGWWISPRLHNRSHLNLKGILVIAALYLIEIIFFWTVFS